MQIKEFYDTLGGDYEDVIGRLMKEERVIKFLNKFADSSEMQDLASAIAAEDWEAAFRASHTIKGVAANLGLTELGKASDALCEELRPCIKPAIDIEPMLAEVKKHYNSAIEAIRALD